MRTSAPLPIIRSIEDDGTEVWRSVRGEFYVRYPHPCVRYSRIVGYIGLEIVPRIVHVQHRLLLGWHRLEVFSDWSQVTGYDPEARNKITESTAEIIPLVKSWNILVLNPLPTMGVNVANAQLAGKIRIFSERAAFYSMLNSAIAEAEKSTSDFPPGQSG